MRVQLVNPRPPLKLVHEDKVLLLQQPVKILRLSPNGLQGAKGDPGGVFDFTQSTPSQEWIINHNLGYKPSVQCFDLFGNVFLPDIWHYSVNQVRVRTVSPVAGFAHLV